MTAMRTIHLPAIDRRVSLAAYLAAVKKAKANPSATFAHGLTCWWPCTGEEILRQFSQGVHARINDAIPYTERGKTGFDKTKPPR
jgi:hypothetical protein